MTYLKLNFLIKPPIEEIIIIIITIIIMSDIYRVFQEEQKIF